MTSPDREPSPPTGPPGPPFVGKTGPMQTALIIMGVGTALGAALGVFPGPARWILGAGGLLVAVLAPFAARRSIGLESVSEAGVSGAGFWRPVFIPWNEVDRVCEDQGRILVQSRTRSARLDIQTVRYGVGVGGLQTNFDNPRELVLFILSHVPKYATIELDRYLPE